MRIQCTLEDTAKASHLDRLQMSDEQLSLLAASLLCQQPQRQHSQEECGRGQADLQFDLQGHSNIHSNFLSGLGAPRTKKGFRVIRSVEQIDRCSRKQRLSAVSGLLEALPDVDSPCYRLTSAGFAS